MLCWIEPRTSCKLSKYSTVELYPQPRGFSLFSFSSLKRVYWFLQIWSTELGLPVTGYEPQCTPISFCPLKYPQKTVCLLMFLIMRTRTYTIRHEEVCTHRINVHKCLVFFLVWAHAFYGRNELLISLVKVWERHDYGCTCVVRDRKMNGVVL